MNKFMIYKFSTLLLFLFSFASCSLFNSIGYYDSTTYKNLTDLKPQVIFVYGTFKEDEIHKNDINQLKLKFAQAYEYELGKGDLNKPTASQIKDLQDIFNEELKSRLEDGKWSELIYTNSVKAITRAFDIAIKSEASKNKFTGE